MFVVRQYEGYEIRKNVEWVKVLMWGNEECVNVYRGANECKGVTGRCTKLSIHVHYNRTCALLINCSNTRGCGCARQTTRPTPGVCG